MSLVECSLTMFNETPMFPGWTIHSTEKFFLSIHDNSHPHYAYSWSKMHVSSPTKRYGQPGNCQVSDRWESEQNICCSTFFTLRQRIYKRANDWFCINELCLNFPSYLFKMTPNLNRIPQEPMISVSHVWFAFGNVLEIFEQFLNAFACWTIWDYVGSILPNLS